MWWLKVTGLSAGCLWYSVVAAGELGTPKHVTIYNHPYGLELNENTELTRQLRPVDGALDGRHYQGKLTGHDSSWVRVSQIGGQWKGIASLDGQVYLIEMPVEQAAGQQKSGSPGIADGAAVTPALKALPVSEFQPVVCGAKHREHAKTLIDPNIHSALQLPGAVQFSSLCDTKVDGVCLLAEVEFAFDRQFQQAFGGNARAEAESLINMTEGFYRNDFAIVFDVITLELLDSNVFSTTTDSGDLLDDVVERRNRNQLSFIKSNSSLFHLVSGRDFDERTVGKAFIDVLCQRSGVGISQLLRRFNGSPNLSLTAVVVAHELGHNFGADHDVDDNNCSAGFIMEPSVNASAAGFSSCSQGIIEREISNLSAPEACFNFPVDTAISASGDNPSNIRLGETITQQYQVQTLTAYRPVSAITVTGSITGGQGEFTQAVLEGGLCNILDGGKKYECRINNPAQNIALSTDLKAVGNSRQSIEVEHSVSFDEDGHLKEFVPANNMVGSALVVGPEIPAAPGNLTAVLGEGVEVILAWEDNTDNEDNFAVERRELDGGYITVATLGSNVTAYTDTTAQDNTTYEYQVLAYVNGNGDSEPSNVARIDVVSDAPAASSGASVSQGSGTRVTVSWRDNSNNESGFRVERRSGNGSFSELTSVDRNIVSYTDTTASAGVSYGYRIVAFNARGDADASNIASITPATASSGNVNVGNAGGGGGGSAGWLLLVLLPLLWLRKGNAFKVVS